MSDTITPEQRHNIMSHIHSASTKPELCLRRILWHKGFRFRLNRKTLPGTPDLVFPKYHTVIFVHGCFWHGHVGCRYHTIPKTNAEFWTAKVARNQKRDQEVWRQLEAKGWFVIIVWECQLKKVVLDETIARVEAELLANRKLYLRRAEERTLIREQHLGRIREVRRIETLFKKELQKKGKRI